MENNNLLALILQYQMSKEESLVFRIALLYIQIVKKYFPDYSHQDFKKGDPRKKILFKYCWKLLKETDLKPEEYSQYIQAQMSVLKNVRREGNPHINPNCLVGEKAWKRWLVWKKYFDNVKSIPTPKTDSFEDIKKELLDTHYVLKIRLGEINKENIQKLLDNKLLFRLCIMRVISPYFILSTPFIVEFISQKGIDMASFGMDQNIIILDEVKAYCKELFGELYVE